MPAHRLHFTLACLGDRTPETLFLARHAAAEVRMSPFAIQLDRAARWSRNTVLTADEGVFGVHALHDALVRRLEILGIASEQKFTPHLTVIYGGGEIAEQPIDPIRWTASEFVLVDSRNSRHELLGRWPLTR